jgi:hypothetical protein
MSGVEPVELEMDIQEYPAGYVVPVRNSEAIAFCLKILSNHPEILQAKREAALGIRDAGMGLNWSSYAQRAIAAYEDLQLK